MWGELVTLLHPPYTAWHVSYVAIGAAAAPRVYAGRTSATLLAFFLAVGIGAHAFDELHDRPLETRFSDRALAIAGGLALAAAVGLGVVGIATVSATLAPLVVFGAAICLAYNLELFGGWFHNDLWFALAWGVFPALTGYWANALRFSVGGALVAASCAALSVAQRRLSTPARMLRRRTTGVSGEQRLADGSSVELSPGLLLTPLDGALQALSVAVTLLAAGLLAARL
ncbi:MAG: hypothetical protein M3Z06_05080 [Actinomycetota bacterium]|nr:hypothetical protein [Actinomycetota bacterium]